MAPDRGAASKPSSSRAWDALTPPLADWILTATSAMGFERMTPVQASTIPLFMAHKDVVVEAVTGSGKTLAFLIPLVERLLRMEEPIKKHHVGAIILSPTRELATQIYKVLLELLEFHEPSAMGIRDLSPPKDDAERRETSSFPASTLRILPQLLLGGSSTAARDLSTFLKTSPNLLVTTPGRLLEILSSPYVHCPQSSFEALVLDEADRLLDLGFKDDLTKIISLLPKQRRTGLFSASVSEALDQIIRVGLRNPVRIAVRVKGASGAEDKRTPASLQMTYSVVKPSHKLLTLTRLLEALAPTPLRTIVYLSTCAAVDYFQSIINPILPPNMTLVPLHGKQPPNVRQKNFVKFTNSASAAVLLTTDVAARGLDIPSVDLVVQLDPPSDPKAFLHRCGRAGRAGRKGLAVVFLSPGREEDYISFLDVRQTPITQLETPSLSTTDEEARAILDIMRKQVLTDRAIYDKAQKAFVSWVRSYSKHQASSIFRVADLDWIDLAKGWALLKMPKMPELKNVDRTKFNFEKVDWDSYAYKDRQREKARKEQVTAFANGEDPSAGKEKKDTKRKQTEAWSNNLERKARRETKRSKKATKREHERVAKMTVAEKEHEVETQSMIEKVRRQQLDARTDGKFEGFD